MKFKKKEVVKKVIDYIENNLEQEIDLDKIAEIIGYSKFHLNRMFTEETNVTIHKYLQIRRLTVAAEKLVKPICQLYKLPMKRDIIHNKHFHWLLKQIYLYS